jgi:predicted amino acid-binding ACT domain protein
MSETVHITEYFYVEVPDKPGEGARHLAALEKAGINLLAFSGFPAGRKAQIDFVPEDPKAFRRVARQEHWTLTGAKKVFLIRGDDRVGVGAELLGKLAAAQINVIASQAIAGGAGRFGMLLWVAPRDIRKAAQLLGATPPQASTAGGAA